MTLALHLFKKGERVRMTTDALESGLQGQSPTSSGTVTKDQSWPDYVNVRRDGMKQSERYWVGFWEPGKK